MELASQVFLALGALCVVVGILWAVVKAIHDARQSAPKAEKGPTEGGPLDGLTALIKALTAFFALVFKQPDPWKLIAVGVLLLVLGGALAVYDRSTNARSSELVSVNLTS